MKRFHLLLTLGILTAVALVTPSIYNHFRTPQPPPVTHKAGDPIDQLNGVTIFHNGSFSNTSGRHRAPDGYNFGLRYQCVEFVKRYYYQHLKHPMPDTWGHAKDFFDPSVADGKLNTTRALLQFKNGSRSKPQPNDLLIFGPSDTNPYGHVAIVSKVNDKTLEIAQQNTRSSRAIIPLSTSNKVWTIDHSRALGWLRTQ